jgi:hypothetical protein
MQDTLSEEPTLRCRISQDRLRHVATALNAVVDEAILNIDAGGIHVAAVDPANVAMVSLNVVGSELREFEAHPAELGLNISRVVQVLEHIPHSEPVTLAYDNRTDELSLHSGTYQFSFATTEPDSLRSPPDLPDLEVDAELEISAQDLADAVAYADEFGKELLFEHDEGAQTLHLRACKSGGRELAAGEEASVTLHLHDELVHADGDIWTLLSLGYLDDIAPALPHQTLTLRAGEEYPVEFSYDQLGAGEPWVDCTYIVAPRRVHE